MDITVEIFDKICRVCLTQASQKKSLFMKQDGEERNLFDILSFTANINVKLDDSLPKQVCVECETLMYKADAFKRRCLESETLLKNIWQNSVGDDKKLPQVGVKLTIKREQNDLEDNFDHLHSFNHVDPTSSQYEEGYDKNNVLKGLAVCSIVDASCDTDTKSVIPLTYPQPGKQEAEDDHHDYDEFPIDFNSTQTFETVPLEFSPEKPIKSENKVYKCICGLQFTNEVKYKSHSKQKLCFKYKRIFEKLGKIDDIIHLNNKLKCAECDLEFNNPNKLIAHQRSQHKKPIQSKKLPIIIKKDEVHQCSLCPRKFTSKKLLNKHIKRHPSMDNRRHECDICKRVFKYKAFLDKHKVTRHSKSNNLVCPICLQTFTSEEMLKEHKDCQKDDKKHQCNICQRAFGMLCTLKEHMRTHTGEKPFLCSECGKGFSQKTNLGQHMRRHQGLKPFKCENCEKRFVSKGELEAHSRKHSGAHPFICDDCGNGFTTSSALVKHRRIHTGERPYLCDLCPMRFAASGTLKNHRRIHTGERPFQCVHCDKAFVQRNDLISHIRCHTGEKPYVCTQCGQSFRKASGLKTHVKMHVKEPVAMIHHGVKEMLGLNCEAMKDGFAAIDNYVPKIGE